MGEKTENKSPLTSDETIASLEEIKDDMKTIGTRATWLLGILVLAILGFANFLFSDSSLAPEVGSLAFVIRATVMFLCGFYLIILLVYIPLLIVPKFGKRIHKIVGTKDIQKSIEVNTKLLDKLHKQLRSLVSLVIISTLGSLLFVLGAWWYLSG